MDPPEIDEVLKNQNLKALVLFTGLDLTNNADHLHIFKCFCDPNRQRSAPLQYGTLTADNELFRRKAGGSADERLPSLSPLSPVLKSSRGVLKRSWAKKYLLDRPALVVCFLDLNWSQPSWAEKKTECESKINSLRQTIGPKEIRIALVLVQDTGTNVQDTAATEKATELCLQCKLSSKQLFVLPKLMDQLVGCVFQLEKAFGEWCLDSYWAILKRIRAKSVPNNDAHLLLRQKFKLAFISELRQDTHSALRYYKQAYQSVAEMDFPVIDAFEFFTIASLLNFKICELNFLHNSGGDAVAQFRHHESTFFNRAEGQYPSIELAAIERSLWKSQQCRLFADLFEVAVVNGLAAYSFQNPGRVLEESAHHYRRANFLIRQLRRKLPPAEMTNLQIADPLQSFDYVAGPTTYYGQRPWRVGQANLAGLADQVTEYSARLALEKRLCENYQVTLHLVSSAVAQYKRYGCIRMQQLLIVALADDYVNLGQSGKALQLLNHVLTELSNKCLHTLFHLVLHNYLLIAYCAANIGEYLWAAVQLLGLPTNLSSPPYDVKTPEETQYMPALGRAVGRLLNREASSPPPCPYVDGSRPLFTAVGQLEVENALPRWQHLLQNLEATSPATPHYTIDVTQLRTFVHCDASFCSGSGVAFAGHPLLVEVVLMRRCADGVFPALCAMHYSLLVEMQGNQKSQLITLQQSAADAGATLFHSGRKPTQRLTFVLRPTLEGTMQREAQLILRKFVLTIGGSASGANTLLVNLEWALPPPTMPSTIDNSSDELLGTQGGIGTFSTPLSAQPGAAGCRVIKILPPKRALALEGPKCIELLIDEAVDVPLSISNNETQINMRNIRVIVHQLYQEDAQHTLIPVFNQEVASLLGGGQSVDFPVRINSKASNCVGLQVHVSCTAQEEGRSPESMVEVKRVFPVECGQAFQHSVQFYAQNGESADCLVEGQLAEIRVLIQPNCSLSICASRWNLQSRLEQRSPNHDVNDINSNGTGTVSDSIITLATTFTVTPSKSPHEVPPRTPATSIHIGDLILEWKRSALHQPVRTVVDLGQMPIVVSPLLVRADVIGAAQDGLGHIAHEGNDPELTVRTPFVVKFHIQNTWGSVLSLRLESARSELYAFSGYKQMSVRLLPGGLFELTMILIALATGRIAFPKLSIRCLPSMQASDEEDVCNQLIEQYSFKSLPLTLHILP